MEEPTIQIKIRDARKAKSLTQSDLAEMVGLSQKTIQTYETNGGINTLYNLKKIAIALNISLSELIGEEAKKISQTGSGNIQIGQTNTISQDRHKIEMLEQEVESLTTQIKDLRQTISAKDALIELLQQTKFPPSK